MTSAASDADGRSHRNVGLSVKAVLRGLVWDVGVPVASYYILVALGVSAWAALLTGSVLAAVPLVGGIVRDRTLNPFAMVMLTGFGLGLALFLVSGDVRFLLAVKSSVTGVIGLLFLGSTLGTRPLTLAAQQRWSPAAAGELTEEYRTDPEVRHGHRVCSTVWGVGLLVEALLRVAIVYLLPLDVAVGASTVLLVVTLIGLTSWSVRYIS